ncbi:MAG TPA: pyridoxamine 5'-phosphate oxidase family protein [Candidatus Gemmiger avistercoris]|uniref:Pyridoxamine 5'-phosphate oxidase family protein n=1 Tax=Candidatus Gemmiger avistercoris TaxID=2838606 RepID=A0A9D2FL88_9FIRM|nr:pyridoxamine 5'-phosphate oxidase family protein [uncultured Subdoligranulum sp.]HIZ62883.1 pyridoxamine 5'-phosphate oxidase family protein [Candidatus Gemmiger avistercoris]
MFRAMRRKKQQLSPGACAEILRRGTSGVLAVAGDGGYPYAVPLSYVYDGQTVYFHSANTGHKVDAIVREPRVSFCVIDRDEVLPEAFTTAYRSVIVFGRVRVLEKEEEKRAAVEKLALRYAPNVPEADREAEIDRFWPGLCMLALEPEQITGKEGLELTQLRGSAQ